MAFWPDKFEQVVVVLSTGRTGTQALAHYFNAIYDNGGGAKTERAGTR